MNQAQYTVVFLLLVLFSLEAMRNKTVYNWLVSGLNNISSVVKGK